jgi:hypothetical protein
VRRIGEELAQAVLAGLALAERPLQPVEHRIERDPEAPHLGARIGRLDAVREVAAGDRARGVPHAVERQQADAHDQPRHHAEEGEDRRDHERQDDEQTLEVVVRRAQRDRGDVDRRVAWVALGEHPVARVRALLAVDGEDAIERDAGRQLGPRADGLACRLDWAAAEHLPGRAALLDVGPRREPEVLPPAGRRAVVAAVIVGVLVRRAPELEADLADPVAQLLIDAVVQERPLLDVRHPAQQQQADGSERQHRRQQPRPQRGHHVRGWRSA